MRLIKQHREHIKTFFAFVRFRLHFYVFSTLLRLVSSLIDLIPPVLYMVLMNKVLVEKQENYLVYVIVGYVLVFVSNTGLITAVQYFQQKFHNMLIVRLKSKFFKHICTIDGLTYNNYPVAELKDRLENDINAIETIFTSHTGDLLLTILKGIILSILMLMLSPIMTVTGFITVPVALLVSSFLSKRIEKINQELRDNTVTYESFLDDTYQNWREVKSNSLQQEMEKEFLLHRKKISKTFVKSQLIWYLNRAFIAFKDNFIVKLNIYFLGGLLIIYGKMDIGQLFAFMNYYGIFFAIITSLGNTIISMRVSTLPIERLQDLMQYEDCERVPASKGHDLYAEDLYFRYPGQEDDVLKGIGLDIREGKHLAIIGSSGCGKTTLTKLLTGIYRPDRGSVRLNETDVYQLELNDLNRKIGMVAQDPVIINVSLRENLLFALPSATDEQLWKVLRSVKMDTLVESMPDGLDTVLGERGIVLSGGQKQRLSIARLLLQDPEIFVLDEATSSLDTENENAVVELLKGMPAEKTLITIAHRLSTITHYHRLIFIENGRIVASGTHDELMKTVPGYALFFRNSETETSVYDKSETLSPNGV